MNAQRLFAVFLAGISLGCSSDDGDSMAGADGGGGSSTGGSGGGTAGVADARSTTTGGTGGTGGGDASGSGGTGGAARDAGASVRDAGLRDMAAPGQEAGAGGPAAALHDQVITVPCAAPTTGGSCNVAANLRAYEKPFTIGGDPATTYRVTLKICAVYEGHPYSGCMTSPDSPRICINGTPGATGFAPTYPTLGLRVANPARTYFLNSGDDWPDDILKLDYTATFEMQGGSVVTMISDGGTNNGIFTPFQMNRRHTCANVPGIAMQPFVGQFIHLQVVSTTPMN